MLGTDEPGLELFIHDCRPLFTPLGHLFELLQTPRHKRLDKCIAFQALYYLVKLKASRQQVGLKTGLIVYIPALEARKCVALTSELGSSAIGPLEMHLVRDRHIEKDLIEHVCI